MVLPASGRISLLEIAEEFDDDYDDNLPYRLTEFYAGGTYVPSGTLNGAGTAIPTSGRISLTDFYGASRDATVTTSVVTRYARAASQPGAPSSSTETPGSPWTFASEPDPTTTRNVYKLVWTRTYHDGVFQSASGVITKVALRLPTVNVTITGDTSADSNTSVTLGSTVTGDHGSFTRLWSGGGTGPTVTLTRTTSGSAITVNVTLTVTAIGDNINTSGEVTAADTHSVTFNLVDEDYPLPVVTISNIDVTSFDYSITQSAGHDINNVAQAVTDLEGKFWADGDGEPSAWTGGFLTSATVTGLDDGQLYRYRARTAFANGRTSDPRSGTVRTLVIPED